MFLLLIMSNSVWGLCLKPTAKQGAIADTVTTGIALNFTNAIEVNPLGFIGSTIGKILLLNYRDDLPKESQEHIDNIGGSLWMGAAINNVLVIVGAATPVSIFVGLTSGIIFYNMPPCEEKNN
jgi:hypothetical protein